MPLLIRDLWRDRDFWLPVDFGPHSFRYITRASGPMMSLLWVCGVGWLLREWVW